MGRRKYTEPTNRDKYMLEALREGHSQAEVGRVYDVSRQYVHAVKNKWAELAPKVKPVLKNRSL